jgi:predicted phosphodiesterase
MSNVLIIPDTHFPFHHPGLFDFLSGVKKEYKPKLVVHIGDMGDQHGWSRHERETAAQGAEQEDCDMIAACRQLYSIFPQAKACIGNHDTRLAKAANRGGIPRRLHLQVDELYESPNGWEWAEDFRIDGVFYTHGEGYSGDYPAAVAARELRTNTVIGHIHSAAAVHYMRSKASMVWGMSVGCLIDEKSPGLMYAKVSRKRPILGCGVIVDGEPFFIRMGEDGRAH